MAGISSLFVGLWLNQHVDWLLSDIPLVLIFLAILFFILWWFYCKFVGDSLQSFNLCVDLLGALRIVVREIGGALGSILLQFIFLLGWLASQNRFPDAKRALVCLDLLRWLIRTFREHTHLTESYLLNGGRIYKFTLILHDSLLHDFKLNFFSFIQRALWRNFSLITLALHRY